MLLNFIKRLTLRDTLSKFVGGIEKLDKLLRFNKCPSSRSRHGYEGEIYNHNDKTVVSYFYGKTGHMESKCRHMPKIRSSKVFKTNKKGPKEVWVSKKKIILVAYIFNQKKDTSFMVFGQRMLMTQDRRKVYLPMPNPYAWWNSLF